MITIKAVVLPVFLFDPRQYRRTARGCDKTGPFRAKFLYDSVLDLRQQLRGIGSDLLVAPRGEGDTHTTILCQEQVTSEELRVDRALRSALPAGSCQFKPVWGGSLSELPYRQDLSDLPDGFTPFRNKAGRPVESRCEVRAPIKRPGNGDLPLPPADALAAAAPLSCTALPPLPEIGLSEAALGEASRTLRRDAAPDPRGVMPFPGGEAAALARHYLAISLAAPCDALATYFETRNGMLGADYSSKFAPWLAHGCLSPRQVAHECRRYEGARVQNKSTYWMGGPIGSHQSWRSDAQLLQRWKDGELGVPLVDANMRELKATGFMSNRGRQNVASYLALDLQLDWREGAEHFEALLLDYDVCSNWGNWVSAAGLTGGRVNRFNIVKQSKDYDADGAYVRHWLPELKDVPSQFVHEPWKMGRAEQERFGCRIGTHGDAASDYPNPPKISPLASYHGFRHDIMES
ncbi:hypothetical protein EMIHUDRAFT_209270 [Emiliania huxleyi CCMP1516]|uniref:Photolyase/cryptochrome alpha/beta domain-containing protein n=2 Tax=Emiliania huxleyi TaxID=2903 RepID=A0A0D3J7Z1_EMIH1|nr:hypothetical protein EMIHUDRAFT_209270 [Emiliania huxleyi CCMP1516]EOD19626.1 hypothetical protein EMIHUDRAFT_209270 [Emiliania huxleyi CCMP1516]|eukprot:XP_005772055.1 hypothetical protein EMIHUDRAFT_209270 [Emiliania huxleyi CCMP1516]